MECGWKEENSHGCLRFRSTEDYTIERRSYGKALHPSGSQNVDNVGANWMSMPDNIKYGKTLQPSGVRNVDNEDARTSSNWFLAVNNLKLTEIKYGKPSQYNYVPNVINNGAMMQSWPNTSRVSNGANIFSQLSDFFTTTVVEQAKAIWRAFVSAITSLAKWVMEEVTNLWNTAVAAVKNISYAVANFLKKFWYNDGEFVTRLHRTSEKVQENVADAVMNVADKMTDIALGRPKKILKAQGYPVESMSNEEIKECWKIYMKGKGLTPQEEADADAILNGHKEKGGGATKAWAASAFGVGRSCNYASSNFSSCNYSSNFSSASVSSCDYSSPGMSYHSSEMSARNNKKARPLTREEEEEANLILNGPSN